MKSITSALADHLAGDTTTTARLWKIKRKATTEVTPATAYFSTLSSASQSQISEGSGSSSSSSGTFGSEESVGTSYALADLSDNNTSASASWSDTSNGDAVPADTSKVSIKSALYAGATTRVLAHMVAWFYSGSSHISVGYFDDATQIANAIADMKARGIDGVILDWYGQGSHSDTVAGYIKAACEADGTMTFAICIDKGTFSGSSNPTSDFEAAVAYVQSTYFGSTAYEKDSSRPLLLEFGCEKLAIDWAAVRSYMNAHGNPKFIWQDLSAPTGSSGISGGSQDAFAASYTDGCFSWVGVSAASSTDPEALNYLKNFYHTAQGYPTKLAMGSVRKGFNDALASWGTGRVMTQANGSTWADSFTAANDYYSSSQQLPYLQVVTWDDYEEGTEVETGIATNLAFASSSASGNTVSWTTSGNLVPFDHIGVYASSDGGLNYTFLGKVSKFATSADLVAAFSLAAGSYEVRLRAVGISCVQSVLSSDISITVSGSGGTAVFNDWEFVNGQWQTTSAAPAGQELEWLYASGFNANIPATATIIGAVAGVVYSAQGPTSSYIQEVSLFSAGSPPSPMGTEKTPHLQFTPSQQIMSQGSKTDMWGLPAATLDPALVNASTFGFAIRPYYDGVRLYVNQLSLTIYYTLAASGVGGSAQLVMSATLNKHTNFTGGVEADGSADSTACSAGASLVFDSDGKCYVNANNGAVHYFDGTTGELLGALGTFGTPSVSPHFTGIIGGGGMRILNHPTRGKWLVVADGPAWGENFQLMAIAAKDGAGNPISPGTVTNVLNTMYGGIQAGGNTGGWDVDANGNIWLFGHNFTAGSAAVLIQVGFSGDTTIGILSTTDFAALYGWAGANGALVDPLTGTVIVAGADATGNNVSRYDPSSSTFLATNRTLGSGLPVNVGADGNYILYDGLNFDKVRVSDLTIQGSASKSSYSLGIVEYHWYDPNNNFVWVIWRGGSPGGWSVRACDFANPGTYASLSDPNPESGYTDISICWQGTAVSTDGLYFVTQWGPGVPPVTGFIDFWGTAFSSGGGMAGAYTTIGLTDSELDRLI